MPVNVRLLGDAVGHLLGWVGIGFVIAGLGWAVRHRPSRVTGVVVGLAIMPLAFLTLFHGLDTRYTLVPLTILVTFSAGAWGALVQRMADCRWNGSRSGPLKPVVALLLVTGAAVINTRFGMTNPSVVQPPLQTYEVAGDWIARQQEGSVVMARRDDVLGYYAKASRTISVTSFPLASLREIVDEAQRRGATWVVVGPVEMQFSPSLAALGRGEEADSRLEVVHSTVADGVPITVYRVTQR